MPEEMVNQGNQPEQPMAEGAPMEGTPPPQDAGMDAGSPQPLSDAVPQPIEQPSYEPEPQPGPEPVEGEQPDAPAEPTETPAPEDEFTKFLEGLRGEYDPQAEPTEPQKDKPYRKTFVPENEVGKILGTETDPETGDVKHRIQISTVDDDGGIVKREYLLTTEELAKKWNYATLDFTRQQLDKETTTVPQAQAPDATATVPEFDFDLGLGGPSDLPTEPADALAVDSLATPIPVDQASAPAPPAQGGQMATVVDFQRELAAQEVRASFDAQARDRIKQQLVAEYQRRGDDLETIDRMQFEQEVSDRVDRQFDYWQKTPAGQQYQQNVFQQKLNQVQTTWQSSDIAAEYQLGEKAAAKIMNPAKQFCDHVLIHGMEPRTPEEKFLARNGNWMNTRLLVGLALDALRMRREVPKYLSAAEAKARKSAHQAILDKWESSRKAMTAARGGQPASGVASAAQMAAVPGSGSPDRPSSFAQSGAALPPDSSDDYADSWGRLQAHVQQGAG